LPRCWADYIGLECCISRDPTAVDLAVRVCRGSEAYVSLADTVSRGGAGIVDLVGKGICTFVRAWAEPSSELNRYVDEIWLEFDDPSPGGGVTQLPSVFFSTYGSKLAAKWIADRAICLLLDRPVPDAIRVGLARCSAFLPADGRPFHVGLMLSRGDPTSVRLCIEGIPPGEIVPYLLSLGWAENKRVAGDLIKELAVLADNIALDLDASATVGRKIGLECCVADDADRRAAFFDYLVAHGLARRTAVDALARTCGGFFGLLEEEERTDGGSLVEVVWQSLNLAHVKIILEDGIASSSKAYLLAHSTFYSLENHLSGGDH